MLIHGSMNSKTHCIFLTFITKQRHFDSNHRLRFAVSLTPSSAAAVAASVSWNCKQPNGSHVVINWCSTSHIWLASSVSWKCHLNLAAFCRHFFFLISVSKRLWFRFSSFIEFLFGFLLRNKLNLKKLQFWLSYFGSHTWHWTLSKHRTSHRNHVPFARICRNSSL